MAEYKAIDHELIFPSRKGISALSDHPSADLLFPILRNLNCVPSYMNSYKKSYRGRFRKKFVMRLAKPEEHADGTLADEG